MTVYDYRNAPHPGGSRGIRVVRMVAGEFRQRWFAGTQYDYDRACRLDARWEREQRASQRQTIAGQVTESRRTIEAPTATAFIGIRMQFSHEASGRWVPAFKVAIDSRDGRATTRRITPTTRTLAEAWADSTLILAGYRGLKRRPAGWRNAVPTWEAFEVLRRWRNERGDAIPVEAVEWLRDASMVD